MKRSALLFAIIVAFGVVQHQIFALRITKKEPLRFSNGDSFFEFSFKFRPEAFYGYNNSFLNDCNNHPNGLDKIIIPLRITWDGYALYVFGRESYGHDVVVFKSNMRTKTTAGDPDSIASTGESTVKIGSLVTGLHYHRLQRLFTWVRELSMQICLNDVFNFEAHHLHFFRLGLFPVEFGRGISLGAAYAVDPDILGWYSCNAVDQYAPGFLFTGGFGWMLYDIYVAILNNRSDTFDNVNLRIRGHEYGHRFNQARGFGIFNWLIGARLKGIICDEPGKKLYLEPYAFYNNDREQKVEFLGDAASKLGTLGFCFDAEYGKWEASFEIAKNVGYQKVKGIDRNSIEAELRDGVVYSVNSQVIAIADSPTDQAGKKAVDTPANQKIIDTSCENSNQNCKQIDDRNLKNSKERFRNGFKNRFKGWMFVADLAYNFTPKLRWAFASGIATGDECPNKQLDLNDPIDRDSDFRGFIGLQEQYSGKPNSVRSAFLLSGVSKIPRLLSFPEVIVPGDPFPLSVSRFTNLIFIGSGFYIKCDACSRCWCINPNILSYWQDNATRVFKCIDGKKTPLFASKHLGVELNTFVDTQLFTDLRLYVVFGLFIPGKHYKDVKGHPLNKEQQKFLDTPDSTGIKVQRVPVLGDDKAYFFNAGLEYRF